MTLSEGILATLVIAVGTVLTLRWYALDLRRFWQYVGIAILAFGLTFALATSLGWFGL